MDIDYTKYHRDKEYQENEELFKNIFKKRYNLISQFVKNPKKVLDIGCSNGIFLDLFKQSETWGVEPSTIANSLRSTAHRIINTYFEKAKLPEKYFDLVIMNHTLEHVKNADEVLRKIYRILETNGILFIDVPNAGGLGSKLLGNNWPYRLPDEHTYQFTRASLLKKVRDSGFNVLHWESRSGLLEFENPWLELWKSLTGFKKRFIFSVLASPYHLVSSALQMGDSMSVISRKN